MEKLEYNGITYTVGMRVRVTDGKPRPPERFCRKLEAWKDNNYSGEIMELGEPRDYCPHGTVTVRRDDYPDRSYMKMRFTGLLGHTVYIPEDMKEAA